MVGGQPIDRHLQARRGKRLRPLPIVEGERVPNTGLQFKKDPDFMAFFLVESAVPEAPAAPAKGPAPKVAETPLAKGADHSFVNFAEDDTSCEMFYVTSLVAALNSAIGRAGQPVGIAIVPVGRSGRAISVGDQTPLVAWSSIKVPLVGVCTGTFVLHRVGLMRGYRACVSWLMKIGSSKCGYETLAALCRIIRLTCSPRRERRSTPV